jgi:hypothetical protein
VVAQSCLSRRLTHEDMKHGGNGASHRLVPVPHLSSDKQEDAAENMHFWISDRVGVGQSVGSRALCGDHGCPRRSGMASSRAWRTWTCVWDEEVGMLRIAGDMTGESSRGVVEDEVCRYDGVQKHSVSMTRKQPKLGRSDQLSENERNASDNTLNHHIQKP